VVITHGLMVRYHLPPLRILRLRRSASAKQSCALVRTTNRNGKTPPGLRDWALIGLMVYTFVKLHRIAQQVQAEKVPAPLAVCAVPSAV
jgi:hypothetical protein